MKQTQLQILQEMPVFGGISEDALLFLLQKTQQIRINKDEFFFREKDRGSSMFVLETGTVAVIKNLQEQDYLLAALGPGDCFGELALIDFYPRSASVKALETCRAIELSTSALHELYARDLKQFTIIQMNMGREVSRRLRDADERLFRERIINHPEQDYRDFYFI